MPIHSVRVDLLLHNGSACVVNDDLIAFANVMALVLPIKRGLFFKGNVIGLALPTNLLVMGGLIRGGGDFVLIIQNSIFSNSSFFRRLFPWLTSTSFLSSFLVPFG
jgi:hypothetical protein